MILGDYSVGKTNIVRRIFNKSFDENTLTTIGIEFGTLEINDTYDNTVLIQLWDTCKNLIIKAGAEKYKAITTGHLRNADGIILVFDLSNEKSLISLDYWYNMISISNNKSDIKILLIGNKLDLIYEHYISQENIENELQLIDNKISYFMLNKDIFGYVKSSAKENINIQEPFIDFYHNIIFSCKNDKLQRNYFNHKINRGDKVGVVNLNNKESSCC